MRLADGIRISRGYRPGVIGSVVSRHAQYYSSQWGFGLHFEAEVATELSQFLNRYTSKHDGIWLAWRAGHVVGSIVIDGSSKETPEDCAQLRWFIVALELQGSGVGRVLMDQAMEFCRGNGFSEVFLDTFSGLNAAQRIYEDYGFAPESEEEHDRWGVKILEQRFRLKLA